MKLLKRSVVTLLVITAAWACLSAQQASASSANGYSIASGSCGDTLTWSLSEEGQLTIMGTGAMDDYASANRTPWHSNREDIRSVVVEEGVTAVGRYAFRSCANLVRVSIPQSVASIRNYAFNGCEQLTEVYYFGSQEQWALVSIAGTNISLNNATVTFLGRDEPSWELVDGVLTISGNGAILDYESYGDAPWYSVSRDIRWIVIENGVTGVGDFAFGGCINMTGITMADSVTSIGKNAFYNCTGLSNLCLPAEVTEIGENAFYGCGSMAGIFLPGTLVDIGRNAFMDCSRLSHVCFGGTREQWEVISIAAGNTCLTEADRSYGHAYTAVVTEPTCMKQGYTSYRCACGDGYADDFTDIVDHDRVNGLCRMCQKVGDGESHYASVADAIAQSAAEFLYLNFDLAEDVVVDSDIILDLNGKTLTGDITIVEGARLRLFDSATADYTADSRGRIVGGITGDLARTMNTPESYGHNYKYLTIREADGSYSAHRIYLTVRSVSLAPNIRDENRIITAVSYQTVFKCNDVAAQYVTAYGAKFTGDTAVYANYMAEGSYTLTGENLGTAWLTSTLKTTNTAQVNAANAVAAPTVSAYITLSDGLAEEVSSAGVTRSLKDMIVYANGLKDLTAVQKAALGIMYDLFRDVLDAWTDVDLSAIKQYGADRL